VGCCKCDAHGAKSTKLVQKKWQCSKRLHKGAWGENFV